MKNYIINRIVGLALCTGILLSLNSCQHLNVVDDSYEEIIDGGVHQGQVVTLDVDFVSDLYLGTIDLFAFDDKDRYVDSWHLYSAAPFSIRLNKGSYKFAAWSNVSGTFLPTQPLVGVTKISDMKIWWQNIDTGLMPNIVSVGSTKGAIFLANQSIQIQLAEFREPVSFDVEVSNWDIINSSVIL